MEGHSALVQSSIYREAVASVALDKGDHDGHTQSFPAAYTAVSPNNSETTPEVEEGELEEVTIEPDLPMEEPPEPVDQARDEYERRVAAMSPDEPVYVAGNRAPRLKLGDYVLQPGDVVPGAHSWPRREAYERLGRIERR